MDKYRSLAVWRKAHEVVLLILRAADAHYHPRSRALFDQMRRAAISVEANVVEGYALGTSALFRRHVRIALGSAAETECLVRIAAEMNYLPPSVILEANGPIDETIAMLFALLRRPLPQPDRKSSP
ncbi:MAG TPA: four helix bundle protein [Gemmatimonadales bacterium]|nr:four helix bundle protein [Gemmatimonadales bacterium]